VKIGHGACSIGFDCDQCGTDPVENSERQRAADQPIDQITNRQALGGGITADTALKQWVQSRAEIGPEHQRERGMRRHDRLRRTGHDQQNNGHARMRRPGQSGREHNIDQRFSRDRTEEHSQARHVFVGRDHREQVRKRDQHQTQPDPDPAEIARTGDPAAPEHEHADQDEQERNLGYIERQHLDDQRSANVGAQHDRQGGHKVDKTSCGECGNHQSCGGAALKYRCYAQPGQEAFEPVAERIAQDTPELRSEGARDAGLHHVHAPNQQRNRTSEIDEGQSCIHPAPPYRERSAHPRARLARIRVQEPPRKPIRGH